MVPVGSDYNPRSIEGDVLSLWRSRRLPPAGGMLGPPSGPVVRQYIGSWAVGDFPSLVGHRAVAADIDARYLSLAGRRAIGTLRQSKGTGSTGATPIPALLTALGIWTGGDGSVPSDSSDRTEGVQAIVDRLASLGLLTAREETFRACPSCAVPRGLERIVYDEQEGDTYLVRFPVRVGERTVSALVWVDTPWKLLGTSALLVHPNLRYVFARYTRREEHELVLTSASSVERLRDWIPEASFEVEEERLGRDLQGLTYVYPLRHEFPTGGDLTAPAGTLLGANDVDDSGTGIVPLVPGHGPTDAQIAARFGVTGWPLVTAKGKLDFTLMHKYAGLDLATTDEFVLRDLAEAGALFAHLRVKRGVPRCSLCGSSLFWTPGRAWCLELSRLPAERRALFSRLLPDDAFPGPSEVAPWPISEANVGEETGGIALLECGRCERLEPVGGPVGCPCGGQRSVVKRKLLHSVGGALEAWARFDPFPDGDAVHLYVGRRRRVPSVVNHLVGLTGVQGFIGDINVSVVPTVTAPEIAELVTSYGADAVRAALLRSGLSDSPRGQFAAHCRQEANRLRRWWTLSREVTGMCDVAMISAFARPIGGFLSELELEDRAVLARWERVRSLAVSHFDHWAPALVLRGVGRFLENDLVEYREMVRPRLALSGTPSTKRGALRTFAHLLRGVSEVLAPIEPFTSEAVHRSLSPERTSLFERPLAGVDRALVNEELVAAWDRWSTVLRSLGEFRRSMGVPRATPLPSVALVVSEDDLGDKFRAEKETLARLAGVQRLEVGSPKEAWTGRQRSVRPVESEIQKAYPAQASQIIHLLSRMAPRRWEAALGEEELTVVINGLPRRIFPSMVAFADTLPERVVPQRWRLGEMYVELPPGAVPTRSAAPPMSADAFWLVRRVQSRLRASPIPAGTPPPVAVVTAKDPLALELKAISDPLARYLGLREVRVTESSSEPIPPGAVSGRTRTGDRWWVHLPGLAPPRTKEKRRIPASRLERITVSGPLPVAEEFDYTDPEFIAHEEVVRTLGRELDDLIGVPLLGPAKISLAWDKGLHSVEDLRRLPAETVASLPGFGGPVAKVVLDRLGLAGPLVEAEPIGRGHGTAETLSPTPEAEPVVPAPSDTGPSVSSAGRSEPEEPKRRPPEAIAEASSPIPDVTKEAPGEPPPAVPPEESESEAIPQLAREEPPSGPETPAGVAATPEPPGPPERTADVEPNPRGGVAPVAEGPSPEVVPTVAELTPATPEPTQPAAEESPAPIEPGPLVEGESPSETIPEPETEDLTRPNPEIDAKSGDGAVPGPEPVSPTEPVPQVESAPGEESAPEPEAAAPAEPGPVLEGEPVEEPSPEPETETEASTGPSPIAETNALGEMGAEPESTAPVPEAGSADTPPEEQIESTPEPESPVAPLVDVEEKSSALSEGAEEEPPSSEATPSEPAASDGSSVSPVLPPETSPPAEPGGSETGRGTTEPYPPPEPTPAENPETPQEEMPEEVEAPATAPDIPTEGPPVPETIPPEPTPNPPEPPVVGSEPDIPIPTSEASVVPTETPPPASERPVPGADAGSPELPPESLPLTTGSSAALPEPEEPEPMPPVAAVVSPPEPTVEPPPAAPTGIELTVGDSLVGALGGFLEATAAGHPGICVVRESPERIRARIGSRPIDVLWLSNVGRGPSLRPSDLEGAFGFLSRKLIEDRVTAFFLEGIEYLVRLHGADPVLNHLVELDRLARENDARVWVFLNPGLLRPPDLERFRSTFGGASPPAS